MSGSGAQGTKFRMSVCNFPHENTLQIKDIIRKQYKLLKYEYENEIES